MKVEQSLLVCPFAIGEKGGLHHYCEAGRIRLPDAESKILLKTYCCDMQKYKQCTLYQVLIDYYERKYEEYKR